MSTSLGGSKGYNQSGQSSGLKGTGYKQTNLQQFTPEQMSLFQNLFSNIEQGSQLSKLASGDQSSFDHIEAPALKQFGQLQSNMASRFSGMGTGGRRSSGFQNAISSANQDFASQLQSQRSGLQQQAMRDLMGMSSNLLAQRPYENILVPEQKPFWQELSLAGAQGLGHLAGSWMGNR